MLLKVLAELKMAINIKVSSLEPYCKVSHVCVKTNKQTETNKKPTT